MAGGQGKRSWVAERIRVGGERLALDHQATGGIIKRRQADGWWACDRRRRAVGNSLSERNLFKTGLVLQGQIAHDNLALTSRGGASDIGNM